MPLLLLRLLLILLSLSGYSQTKKLFYSVPWNEGQKVVNIKGRVFKAFNIEDAHFSPADSGLPSIVLSIPNSEIASCKIERSLYLPISPGEDSLIPSYFQDTLHRLNLNTIFNEKTPYSILRLIPIRWNYKKAYYEKLISFELEYNEKTKAAVRIENKREEAEIDNSVLANGQWYKIRISDDGVYKIDYSFLRTLGIEPETIDPQKIKLFGYGGGMLPQSNAVARYYDLPEVAILVKGEEDKVFNQEDYIVFYGQGPHKWWYDSVANEFVHEKNLYDEASYYYLTVSSLAGKRVSTESSVSKSGNTITSFNERFYVEEEKVNILHSGREWFGQTFKEQLTHTFSLGLPGLVENSFVKLNAGLASVASVATSFGISANGTPLKSVDFSTYNSFPPYTNIGEKKSSLDSLVVNRKSLNIELTYRNAQDPSGSTGYLDFIRINYSRRLVLGGEPLLFRSVQSRGYENSDFTVDSLTSKSYVWDVSNPLQVKNIPFALENSKGIVTRPTRHLREYAAFNIEQLPTPVFISKVDNQNLHGIAREVPQCIIVSPELFRAQAQRLADYRTQYGIKTMVITPAQIYNEFSSGRQDISAIRDFLKLLYDNSSQQSGLKYLLLFGLASYDYKDRVSNNTNHVPVYESRESLHMLDSYSSDDYFGFLDDYEGEWSEYNNDHLLNLGIGRVPINTIQEAEVVVSKIINYERGANSLGKWRNGITFIADDGDNNLHVAHAEILSKLVAQNLPNLNIDKIYLDAYPQVLSPRGQSVPQAEERIQKAFNSGTLIINYSGHGGETLLSSESVIDQNSLRNYRNNDNLPFMVTATCEYGRYDNPDQTSAAIVSITSPTGGTIGNLTSTRAAFASSNLKLNTAFYNSIFTGGVNQTLGDIFKETKNNKSALNESVNNRNYVILGDPCLKIAFPKGDITVTKFQDSLITSTSPNVKALSKISIKGEVSGNRTFNGSINVRMYDKETLLSTVGDEGGFPTTFNTRSKIFHESNTKVTNGTFSLAMFVPKDIYYNSGQGKMSFYASDTLLNDAAGSFIGFNVGGEKVQVKDTIGPHIKLSIAGSDSLKGYQTLTNILLNIKLSDERGINTSSVGVGHEITASIDGKKPTVLNEYFYSENNDSTTGIIRFPYTNLSKGRHTIKIKAWDTSNNSSVEEISFYVLERIDSVGPRISARIISPGLDTTDFPSSSVRLRVDVNDSNEVAHVKGTREVEIYLNGNKIAFFESLKIEDDGRRVVGSGYLNELKPGVYTIIIKAYDIFNNSSELSLPFRVVDKRDTVPPKIDAFVYQRNLDSTKAINLPTKLSVTVSDLSKIDFVKNVREIEVTIDGQKIPVFDSCVVSASGTEIVLQYTLEDLLPGKHSLKINAWD
ncbi:MAG TPA: type IX secretion system sortase PorU, partial [Cytophagaceae bacterium]